MALKERSEGQLSLQDCMLIYDGECRLCVTIKQKLEKAGVGQAQSDVRFFPYQSESAKKVLGASYRCGRPDVAYLIRPSGQMLLGLDAFLPIIPTLPGGKFLLWWLRFPSIKRLAAWGYRMVARHRYRWFGEVELPSRQE